MLDCPWPLVPLGDLVENFDSLRVPVKAVDRRPGPFPYYGASGVVDHVDDFLFDGEYLLIAEDGENLHTRKTPVAFLANGKFWVNNHAHIVKGNARADTRYLMYALSRADVGAYLTGSTQPKLTQRALHRIPVPTPPIDEQRRIAAVLGAFDSKIELNRQMIRSLESAASAIYESWFVLHDQARGDAAGGEFKLSTDFAALHPGTAHVATGNLGDWTTTPLGDLVSVCRRTTTPAEIRLQMVDHYSIPAFDDGRMPRLENGSTIKSSKLVVEDGTVLVSRLNPRIPRVWFPHLRGRLAVCSTEFLVLLPEPRVTLAFLYGLLQSDAFLDELASRVTGTSGSHQRVKPADALSIEVTLPPMDVVQRFSEVSAPFYLRVGSLFAESERLASVRNVLLPHMVRGLGGAAEG